MERAIAEEHEQEPDHHETLAGPEQERPPDHVNPRFRDLPLEPGESGCCLRPEGSNSDRVATFARSPPISCRTATSSARVAISPRRLQREVGQEYVRAFDSKRLVATTAAPGGILMAVMLANAFGQVLAGDVELQSGPHLSGGPTCHSHVS